MSLLTSRTNRWMITAAIIAIVIATGWSMRHMLSAQTEAKVNQQSDSIASGKALRKYIPVTAITVSAVDHYEGTYQYTGKIVPRRTSQLGFEISGRIETLVVDEGDQVKEQQVLGLLDKKRYQNKYAQVLAQKEQALSQLSQLQSGRTEDLESARAQVRELEAEFNRLEANLKRQQELYSKNVITREAFEQTYFGQIGVKEKLNQAKQTLIKLEQGGRTEEKAAQEAIVKQLEESLNGINIDIKDCELKAPYAGMITKRMHDEGEVLSPGTPIFELIETGAMEVRVGIPVEAVKQIHQTDTFYVSTSSGDVTGTWKTLVPEIDPLTRTQTLILELDLANSRQLVAEEIVRIKVRERLAIDGYWLPTSALIQAGRGLWGCYVLCPIKDEVPGSKLPQRNLMRAEIRIVETIYVDGARTLVRGTIQAEDKVIESGVMKIVNNQIVELMN